jgi:hypothetical protein
MPCTGSKAKQSSSFFSMGWSETESTVTGASTGLLMISVEQAVEYLAGEAEVLGENLPQCRCVHHKSHMT